MEEKAGKRYLQKMKEHIILFGVPRSGTTWLSQILTSTNELQLVHEPDNEPISFLGYHYKTNLPRFPYLKKEDKNSNYAKLFEIALNYNIKDSASLENSFCFRIYNKSTQKIQNSLATNKTGSIKRLPFSNLVVKLLQRGRNDHRKLLKSVHSVLAIPFLYEQFKIKPIIIIRNPLSIFSSYLKLEMADMNRELFLMKDLLSNFQISLGNFSSDNNNLLAGLQLAIFYKVIENYINENKEIILIQYEDILLNPFDKTKELCRQLSITYTDEMQDFIQSRMKPGKGYQTFRDPKDQLDIWKKRLSKKQVEEFMQGYNMIPNNFEFNYE